MTKHALRAYFLLLRLPHSRFKSLFSQQAMQVGYGLVSSGESSSMFAMCYTWAKRLGRSLIRAGGCLGPFENWHGIRHNPKSKIQNQKGIRRYNPKEGIYAAVNRQDCGDPVVLCCAWVWCGQCDQLLMCP